ncbi:hypothetical protein ACFQT0_11430 [Hymenobacter humi]|uniref:3'-5' exonuclease domain-containing protein n=1 Tax=Hymenobacter humi TaxID=1411620 RepID=A0ABW2U4I3_9BACT
MRASSLPFWRPKTTTFRWAASFRPSLGFEVDKGEQKSNWLKRPLTDAQMEYAANDVLYLLS